MKLVADRLDAAASVSLMDLSVEAECFGAQIPVLRRRASHGGGKRGIHGGRGPGAGGTRRGRPAATGIYVEAIEKAVGMIQDRPVFAGVIGPLFRRAG